MSPFVPRWPWRNPHLQSILPSLLPRWKLLRRCRALREGSRELLLECGEGVRLQALHSPAPRSNGKMAILLHGWEGSAESYYVLSLGQRLYEAGVDVVRLNLRDHGDTHHLNEGIFHSCRLPEVVGAVAELLRRLPDLETWLIGFSLGGNFMLRVAASGDPRVARIAGVIAVSPVLEPEATLAAMERGLPLYQRYFVRKWVRSLLRKQNAWPGKHDFGVLLKGANLRYMTAELVKAHTTFESMESYLSGYAITGKRLETLAVPSLIVTALDDPIIPSADLARLASNPNLTLLTTQWGGHMGFLDSPFSSSWLGGLIEQQMRLA